MLLFDWDPAKAAANKRKHGVTFEQAMEAIDDPRAVVSIDEEHSKYELREQLLGLSSKGLLLVVYVIRDRHDGDVYRIISARKATRKDKVKYEKANV
jgi:uncharacterized DUF497 family protein